jgi:hypothetical protein
MRAQGHHHHQPQVAPKVVSNALGNDGENVNVVVEVPKGVVPEGHVEDAHGKKIPLNLTEGATAADGWVKWTTKYSINEPGLNTDKGVWVHFGANDVWGPKVQYDAKAYQKLIDPTWSPTQVRSSSIDTIEDLENLYKEFFEGKVPKGTVACIVSFRKATEANFNDDEGLIRRWNKLHPDKLLAFKRLPTVDGSTPPNEEVSQYLKLTDVYPAMDAHCRAGIGRTGMYVACEEIYHHFQVLYKAGHLNNDDAFHQVVETAIAKAEAYHMGNPAQQQFVRNYAVELRKAFFANDGDALRDVKASANILK